MNDRNILEDDNIFDRARRFEIYVPNPKARINLGAANLTTDDEGPFGYTGLSLQSDVHLFIDANKHTLFQTGQNYCGQVGGKWLQYSNADMIMSSTANVNLSAEKKLVIAAGAGQGQITAKDHGSSLRMVSYNNLSLHYRVDQIQTSLFEFFHGRRKHDERGAAAKLVGVTDPYFDAGGKAATEAQTKAELQGGFLALATKSLRELLPLTQGPGRAIDNLKAPIPAGGDPVVLLDPISRHAVIKAKSAPAILEYGFSGYFQRYDPYSLIDTSTITNPWAKALAKFRNALTKMRRFVDVTLRYAHLITDNFLLKRAQSAMGAVNHLAAATSRGYNMTRDVFGYWMNHGSGDPLGQEGREFPVFGGVVDEFWSGMAARPDRDDPVTEAENKWESGEGERAELRSSPGPWDLSAKSPSAWTLTIDWEHPARSETKSLQDLVTARGAQPARLSVAAGLGVALPRVNVKVRDAAALRGASPATVAAWAGYLLEVPVDTDLAMSTKGHTVSPSLAKTRAWLANRAAFESQTMDFDVPGGTVTLRADEALELTRVDQIRELQLSVDGAASVTVVFDSSTIHEVDTVTQRLVDEATSMSRVRSAVENALGNTSTVGPVADGSFVVTTVSTGAAARIAVAGGDAPVLDALELSRGDAVSGSDAQAGASMASVTAAELQALLAGLQGLEVGVDSGALVLTSSAPAQWGKDSVVEVSGTLADELFGTTKSVTETFTVPEQVMWGARAGESFYASLISWNHELQKLPEDTRNLVRPIREAIDDVVGGLSSLEKALESATEIGSDKLLKGLPTPKESIGLIAKEGISLGTMDRIVGAGGKGIVFIADGGSGTENHDKFTPKKVESFVNVALSADPIDRLFKDTSPPNDKPPSLGFRVYSDSVVDLFGTYGAQILALGRGKLATKTLDQKDVVGVGTARLAGSHAAEVAAYRKVVISARNPGDKDSTGGQVDVVGQTISIGGFNKGAGATDLQDFVDVGGLGLEPLDLAELAGAEHLEPAEAATLAKDVAALGWTKELRTAHPNTNYVRIHSAKEATMVVGGFMLHLTDTAGVSLGTRKDDAKASKNELDTAAPHFLMDSKEVLVRLTKDGASLFMRDKEVRVQESKTGPFVSLLGSSDTAMMANGNNKSSLKLNKTEALMVSGGTKLSLKSTGAVVLKGTNIAFNGNSIKLG